MWNSYFQQCFITKQLIMSFVLFRMHGKNTPPFTSINYVMYIDNVHVIVRIQSVKWQFWLISSATQTHCLSFQKSYLSFTPKKFLHGYKRISQTTIGTNSTNYCYHEKNTINYQIVVLSVTLAQSVGRYQVKNDNSYTHLLILRHFFHNCRSRVFFPDLFSSIRLNWYCTITV